MGWFYLNHLKNRNLRLSIQLAQVCTKSLLNFTTLFNFHQARSLLAGKGPVGDGDKSLQLGPSHIFRPRDYKTSEPANRILYSYWASSCSWRVRFALKLKDLPYEYKAVDLYKGDQFTPEFEQINPLGYVPVLVDDGIVVSDSLAILVYLEEKYPQNKLLPSDSHRKAVNLQAACIVNSSMQPLHMKSVLSYLEKKLGREESLAWARLVIEKGFTVAALEKLLKDLAGRYSTGDEVCLADVFLAPQISIAIKRFHIDMSKFPTLRRVYESCETLPEFRASLPERQPDCPDSGS